MHLHEFLGEIHASLNPQVYLEVGVQHGTSLNRAYRSKRAIGIDPHPLVTATGNQEIYKMTADDYFENASDAGHHPAIDLGFIDGLHHYEAALRDFLNIERYAHARTVVIFDDVLPRNQEEAAREQCPGDWTGDVWKVTHLLLKYRSLQILEVDTEPTGTLVVYGFPDAPQSNPNDKLRTFIRNTMPDLPVPQPTLERTYAIPPADAIKELENFLA